MISVICFADENWLTGTTSCLVTEEDADLKCGVYAEYVRTFSKEKRVSRITN